MTRSWTFPFGVLIKVRRFLTPVLLGSIPQEWAQEIRHHAPCTERSQLAQLSSSISG